MNRPLTEVYSAALSGSGSEVWQAEVSHRYVLGVYDLMDRITSTFPHVLLENCASGGTLCIPFPSLSVNPDLILLSFIQDPHLLTYSLG